MVLVPFGHDGESIISTAKVLHGEVGRLQYSRSVRISETRVLGSFQVCQ